MVEAGLIETSALTKVGDALPLRGSNTTDRALLSILLALSAFATLGGRLWLGVWANAGKASGMARAAMERGRMNQRMGTDEISDMKIPYSFQGRNNETLCSRLKLTTAHVAKRSRLIRDSAKRFTARCDFS